MGVLPGLTMTTLHRETSGGAAGEVRGTERGVGGLKEACTSHDWFVHM